MEKIVGGSKIKTLWIKEGSLSALGKTSEKYAKNPMTKPEPIGVKRLINKASSGFLACRKRSKDKVHKAVEKRSAAKEMLTMFFRSLE